MTSFSRRNSVTLVAVLSVWVSVSLACAQGLTNTIPKYQAPLLRTFPPSAAEQTSSGTGKFVIFTREQTNKTNEWDFVAGAWECIPSRTNVPITKRVEFCHSSWSARPLLDTLVRDDSDGLYPRFVILQVDTGDWNRSVVNLYDINYRTWDVRCFLQRYRLNAFGLMRNFVFCRDSHDWFRLDAASGNVSNNVPFIPLDVDGAFWLVRKTNENSGAWSYDSGKQQFMGHFGDVEEIETGHIRSLLSPDGKNRAWLLVPFPDNWSGGLIKGNLVMQRHNQKSDIRVPVKLQAKMGSGVPVIPAGIQLRFTRYDLVEFSARQEMNGNDAWVWTIDASTGKTTESQRPYLEPEADNFALFNCVPTPEYLRPHLKNLRHFGRGGMTPAFLMHLGILKQQPEYPDCWVGVSRDGRHILFKARKGPLSDVFIYGDLETKQTVRWACPGGMEHADSLEFTWVETP
jgi:hypothetical protein